MASRNKGKIVGNFPHFNSLLLSVLLGPPGFLADLQKTSSYALILRRGEYCEFRPAVFLGMSLAFLPFSVLVYFSFFLFSFPNQKGNTTQLNKTRNKDPTQQKVEAQ